MTHAANCNYWTDHDEADCTCGVDWKIRWQTEREMYKAWRKRAEKAEQQLADTQSALRDSTELLRSLSDPNNTINIPDQIAANEAVLGGG